MVVGWLNIYCSYSRNDGRQYYFYFKYVLGIAWIQFGWQVYMNGDLFLYLPSFIYNCFIVSWLVLKDFKNLYDISHEHLPHKITVFVKDVTLGRQARIL
jgi:hypothetical protein